MDTSTVSRTELLAKLRSVAEQAQASIKEVEEMGEVIFRAEGMSIHDIADAARAALREAEELNSELEELLEERARKHKVRVELREQIAGVELTTRLGFTEPLTDPTTGRSNETYRDLVLRQTLENTPEWYDNHQAELQLTSRLEEIDASLEVKRNLITFRKEEARGLRDLLRALSGQRDE